MRDASDSERQTDSGSLAEALQRVGQGDREAFRQVYLRTSAKLFGVCLRILGNRTDAEGTLQDVYVTVWQKAGGYDAAKASPITWLATIARNKAIDRIRKRRDTRPMNDDDLQVADETPGAAALMEMGEVNRRLDTCLQELDEEQAGAIRRAFFGGTTYAELAQADGLPLGTLKSRIRRGLRRLKECLQR